MKLSHAQLSKRQSQTKLPIAPTQKCKVYASSKGRELKSRAFLLFRKETFRFSAFSLKYISNFQASKLGGDLLFD